ncbi:MAG: hypothetical protein RMJ88_16295 [Thermogemmata sp.]|nr:hypothetical protein [Thermogemmata sp.]
MVHRTALFVATAMACLTYAQHVQAQQTRVPTKEATQRFLNQAGRILNEAGEKLKMGNQNLSECAKVLKELAHKLYNLNVDYVDNDVLEWNNKLIQLMLEAADFVEEVQRFRDIERALVKGAGSFLLDYLLFGGVPLFSGNALLSELEWQRELETRARELKKKFEAFDRQTRQLRYNMKIRYGIE